MSFLLLGETQTIALPITRPIRTIVAVESVFRMSLIARCSHSRSGEAGTSQGTWMCSSTSSGSADGSERDRGSPC